MICSDKLGESVVLFLLALIFNEVNSSVFRFSKNLIVMVVVKKMPWREIRHGIFYVRT